MIFPLNGGDFGEMGMSHFCLAASFCEREQHRAKDLKVPSQATCCPRSQELAAEKSFQNGDATLRVPVLK
jgi:hypothetical protein